APPGRTARSFPRGTCLWVAATTRSTTPTPRMAHCLSAHSASLEPYVTRARSKRFDAPGRPEYAGGMDTHSPYVAAETRYDSMQPARCGRSGMRLPAVSLGLWQNFGDAHSLERQRDIILAAFDMGITHIDLANNYGPPPGAAERNFGHVLQRDLRRYRDELVISTKAGYWMWPGPYGEWGSRKYLLSSLDQSLTRMGIEYVDIF